MHWTDIHCHINFLEITPKEVIENAQKHGVLRFINIGTGKKDFDQVIDLGTNYDPIYFTLGVHPHEAETFDSATLELQQKYTHHPKMVAIGEIGLDYYYDHAPRTVQQKVFAEQLQLALDSNLPVEIHTRDAEQDTIDILKDFGGRVKGLLHCFTGSQDLAEQALNLGLNISLSGILTFKNAEHLRKICQWLPFDRLHIETDSPFLAPVPKRGEKNQPAYVVYTAEKVAELRGLSLDELSQLMSDNAEKMFHKLKPPTYTWSTIKGDN